jgi:hypothetical protein
MNSDASLKVVARQANRTLSMDDGVAQHISDVFAGDLTTDAKGVSDLRICLAYPPGTNLPPVAVRAAVGAAQYPGWNAKRGKK